MIDPLICTVNTDKLIIESVPDAGLKFTMTTDLGTQSMEMCPEAVKYFAHFILNKMKEMKPLNKD